MYVSNYVYIYLSLKLNNIILAINVVHHLGTFIPINKYFYFYFILHDCWW